MYGEWKTSSISCKLCLYYPGNSSFYWIHPVYFVYICWSFQFNTDSEERCIDRAGPGLCLQINSYHPKFVSHWNPKCTIPRISLQASVLRTAHRFSNNPKTSQFKSTAQSWTNRTGIFIKLARSVEKKYNLFRKEIKNRLCNKICERLW